MRLSIKKSGEPFTELHFKTGPVYLGRHIHSQVFLPDPGVSRRHAVLYTIDDGQWVIEDLDSANKTFLNEKAVHRSSLCHGDTISIAEFLINVLIEEAPLAIAEGVHLDDTMVSVSHDIPTVVRHAGTKDGAAIKMPASKEQAFSMATRMLSRAQDMQQLHRQLLEVLHGEFSARDAWAAIRRSPEGPMNHQGGRRITSELIKRSDLLMQSYIAEAMDKRKYILVPQIPREVSQDVIRSAIISPILYDKDCLGALYADNSKEHEHYTMEDLDFLMLVAIHTGAIMQRMSP
jgi:hypothetical protein